MAQKDLTTEHSEHAEKKKQENTTTSHRAKERSKQCGLSILEGRLKRDGYI